MKSVFASPVPTGSLIARRLPGAYFHDAWAVEPTDPLLSPLGQFLLASQTTPAWVNRLMSLRNQVVSRLGLKDLGHLNVALSVHKGQNPETNRPMLTVSTVVHTHNLLGRLYMLPVAPLHKMIVPSVMRSIG